jgi:2-haloacid dehalogenase
MHIAFDAYGTLLDVHSAATRHEALLGEDRATVSEIWRTRQLEYAWVATLAGRYEPFWTLTRRALGTALALVGRGGDAELEEQLLAAYTDLAPFDDVEPALDALRERGATLSVLSNGDPEMLEKALSAADIRQHFEHVLSVDAVRRFKPDPLAYRVAEDQLGAARGEILFVSSNAWDAAGAAAFGLHSHWLNRDDRPPEYPQFGGVTTIASLQDL